jgi:acetylglutamate kinase
MADLEDTIDDVVSSLRTDAIVLQDISALLRRLELELSRRFTDLSIQIAIQQGTYNSGTSAEVNSSLEAVRLNVQIAMVSLVNLSTRIHETASSISQTPDSEPSPPSNPPAEQL